MSVRPEIAAFLSLGPLPDSEGADQEALRQLEEALHRIPKPVTHEEAIQLVAAFGPDDCFGLAWTLLHLIESTPGGVPDEALTNTSNEWVRTLKDSKARGRARRP